MAVSGVLVGVSHRVDAERVSFQATAYPEGERAFVVLQLGDFGLSMHIFDLATMDALLAAVAEGRDLLTAALAGQDALPVEPASVSA